VDEISDFLVWGGGILVLERQVGCCGFGGRVFDTRGFLIVLPSSFLRDCCGSWHSLLRRGFLNVGGH